MNNYDKNLENVYKLVVLNKKIKKLNDSIHKKIKKNKDYTDFLQNMMNDTINKYNIINNNISYADKSNK